MDREGRGLHIEQRGVWQADKIQWQINGLPEPESVEFRKIGGWDAVLYDLKIADAVHSNIRAHWIQDNAWVEKIAVVKEFSTGLPQIWADEKGLQEVFLNIMLNAVQMMENTGTLTIRTYCEEITEYAARNTDKFKPKDKIVVIEIKDTGAGMDDETLKALFEPFFSTKEKGTGLSLFVCYGIINNHGGVIRGTKVN